MRRRDALTGLAAATCSFPFPAGAEDSRKPFRLGIMSGNPRNPLFWVSFEKRLRDLGYVEGQNLVVDFIDTEGRIEGWISGAKELIRRDAAAIVAAGPEV